MTNAPAASAATPTGGSGYTCHAPNPANETKPLRNYYAFAVIRSNRPRFIPILDLFFTGELQTHSSPQNRNHWERKEGRKEGRKENELSRAEIGT